MSADAMHWHAQLCKPEAASVNDDNQEEECEDNDNSDEYNNEFAFDED